MPEIKQITLYCLAIFDKATGESRVFTFRKSTDCIDCFILYKDSEWFPYSFTQTIYVTESHPLFSFAEDVVISNSVLKIKK